jgi:hypothetical protein
MLSWFYDIARPPKPGTHRGRRVPVGSVGMTDWATISSLATAGATLLLALGTFASVRSANRAARVAERSLLAGLRPVLAPSRLEDPPTRSPGSTTTGRRSAAAWPPSSSSTTASTWQCRCATSVRASRSCRAGTRHWSTGRDSPTPSSTSSAASFGTSTFPPAASASGRGRAGWRRRLPRGRGRRHPAAAPVRHRAALQRHEGGQRTISLFSVSPRAAGDDPDQWLCSVGRHWSLDRPDPR